jgi:hypothetical protein
MSVADIIADANLRVDDAVQEAQSFINEITEIAQDESLGFSSSGNWRLTPWLGLAGAEAIDIPEAEVISHAGPVIREVDLADVAAPDDPSTDQPEVWVDGTIPEFTDEPLPIDMPGRPTTPVPTAPEDPNVKDITVNAWETYDWPDEAERTESAMPAAPEIALDEADMTLPDLDSLVTAPNNDFEYVENEYSSELKSALENLLLTDLVDGGYGINPNDEQKLWDRARDRQTKLNQVALQKARNSIAGRGFDLPPGAWYAAEQEVQMAGDAALNDTNREIALKRSDNYVQARQFAVGQGISLEGALMNYVGAKQERALKAVMAAADFVLQFHNANVNLFNLRLDLRRIYIALHEEQRQTVMAAMEKFKGQLQLLDAEEGRNEGRLKFYQALRQATLDHYEVQRLRDQHTMLDAEIEKLKLEGSKIRAELFATKVRARSDEFDAYASAINGERMKVELFDTQVKAHGHRVDAAVKESQLKQARFEAELSLKLEERERIKIQLAKMEAQVRQAIAQANVDDQYNKELIDIWTKQLSQQQFNVSTKLQRDIQSAQKWLEAINADNNHMNSVMQGVTSFKELKATAAKSGVQLYETMIAGAESALSAVAAVTEG